MPEITSNRTVRGYLVGVASGAASVLVISFLWLLFRSGFGPWPSMWFLGWVVVAFEAMILLAAWIALALALSFIPFVLVILLAHRFRITSWLYYVVCGACAGLPLVLAFIGAARLMPLGQGVQVGALFQQDGPFFCFGGGIGGFVYWYIAARSSVFEESDA